MLCLLIPRLVLAETSESPTGPPTEISWKQMIFRAFYNPVILLYPGVFFKKKKTFLLMGIFNLLQWLQDKWFTSMVWLYWFFTKQLLILNLKISQDFRGILAHELLICLFSTKHCFLWETGEAPAESLWSSFSSASALPWKELKGLLGAPRGWFLPSSWQRLNEMKFKSQRSSVFFFWA